MGGEKECMKLYTLHMSSWLVEKEFRFCLEGFGHIGVHFEKEKSGQVHEC